MNEPASGTKSTFKPPPRQQRQTERERRAGEIIGKLNGEFSGTVHYQSQPPFSKTNTALLSTAHLGIDLPTATQGDGCEGSATAAMLVCRFANA